MCYSLWFKAFTMFPAGILEAEEFRFQNTSRHYNGCIIPQGVTHSLVLLKVGQNNCPKRVELT